MSTSRQLVVAVVLVLSSAAPAAPDGPGFEQIYSYPGPGGRTVYVNSLSRVPARLRARAKSVQLSHISLNEELSSDLQEAVDAQLSVLRSSDYCASVRGLASRSWWRTAWARYSHLIVIGGLLLLFLLASPYLVRTVGTARWVRILMVVVPLCAFLGLGTTVAVRTSRSLEALRQAADPCSAAGSAAAGGQTPGSRANQVHILQQLRQRVQSAHELKGRQLERFLEREGG